LIEEVVINEVLEAIGDTRLEQERGVPDKLAQNVVLTVNREGAGVVRGRCWDRKLQAMAAALRQW